ncbi:MAG: hypothetical protein WB816_15735 [Methylocystis sp.]
MLTFIKAALRTTYQRAVKYDLHYLDLTHLNPNENYDIIHLKHHYAPVVDMRGITNTYQTATINLDLAESAIYSNLSKYTRYDIRRAIKDGVLYSANLTPSAMDVVEITAAHADLVFRKNIRLISSNIYETIRSRGELLITKTTDSKGQPLSYHAYIVRRQIAILLTSVTILSQLTPHERQLAGRANRLNHWEDILLLKKNGITICDLGGSGNSKGLASFKDEFCVDIVPVYYSIYPITFIGNIVVKLRKLSP